MAGDSSGTNWWKRFRPGGRHSARSQKQDGSASATSQSDVVIRPEIAPLPTATAVQRWTDASASLPAVTPATADTILHTFPNKTSDKNALEISQKATGDRAADTGEAGLHIVYDSEDDSENDGQPAEIDVVAVHGLNFKGNTNHARETWAKGDKLWLKDFLPARLGRPGRVMLFAYNSSPAIDAAAVKLDDHAKGLLHSLWLKRKGAEKRPLVFICHSLGGLVVKEALVEATLNEKYKSIVEATCLLVFFATPHQGGNYANIGDIVARIATASLRKPKNDLLGALKQNSNEAMKRLQQARHLTDKYLVVSFFEGKSYGQMGIIVDKKSATLNLPGLRETQVLIDADHSTICKFDSIDNLMCRLVLDTIATEIKRALEPAQNNHSPYRTLSNEGDRKRPKDPRVADPNIESQNQAESSRPSECLQSLAFPEIDNRFHDIQAAAKDTCEWFLQHNMYKEWAASDCSLLWIKGKPGSGKSTLLRHAFAKIKTEPNTQGTALFLSFFFHGRGTELQRTPLGLFRSLLHQILREVPRAGSDLERTFEQRRYSVGSVGEQWRWHENELQDFFKSSLLTVLESRPVWLFIDALDECGEEKARKLVEMFNSLVWIPPSISLQFHICFTCRHYPVVMDGDSRFEVIVEHENKPDISTYVQEKLSVTGTLKTSTIPSLIAERASGVFMWARLVVDRVLELERRGEGLKKIEKAIAVIPPQLDELYLELLGYMDERLASLKLLQWICFATRPLSLDELRWALIIDADDSPQSLQECTDMEDYIGDNNRMEKKVRTLSCGLAEVANSTSSSNNRQVVQFIHQSVKDYFIDNGGLLVLSDNSARPAETKTERQTEAKIQAEQIAHYRLSRACIRYLAMKEIVELATSYYSYTALAGLPFLNYATTMLVGHAQKSEAIQVDEDDLLDCFAWPPEDRVRQWVQIYRKFEQFAYLPDCPPRGTLMVHILSRYNLIRPLRKILQIVDGTDIDAKDSASRTALSWAAGSGSSAAVRLLLDKGAQVDSKDTEEKTPLLWAAQNGHAAVVEQFLAIGKVEVDCKDRAGRTTLSYAAGSGSEEAVKLLLNKGAKVGSRDINGRTPLSYGVALRDGAAAAAVSEAMVKLLLNTDGVEMESKDKAGRMPLSYAAQNGREAALKLLLAKAKVENLEIDSKDKAGRTPLSYAAGPEHWVTEEVSEAVVRQLLATGQVEIDSKDKAGRTPLSYAAQYNSRTVV